MTTAFSIAPKPRNSLLSFDVNVSALDKRSFANRPKNVCIWVLRFVATDGKPASGALLPLRKLRLKIKKVWVGRPV